MESTFSFQKLFFGILILLFAGFLWITMQTCQKADTELGQATDNATGTFGKIGDAASKLKDKTAGMADKATDSAGGMLDKTAEKAGDAYQAASDTAGIAADKASSAAKAAKDMAVKTADRAGEMADKALGKIGEARQAAGTTAASAAEKAKNAFQSKDGTPTISENATGRKVEVAAGYKSDSISSSPPKTLNKPEVTAGGNWIFEDLKFDYNRSELKPDAMASLREVAATLNAKPDLNIEIQGHTDNSGNRDYNLGLSERRAQSVKAFLESQGIAAARMTTKGFGPDRPLFSNFSEKGFAKNRRVEIRPFN